MIIRPGSVATSGAGVFHVFNHRLPILMQSALTFGNYVVTPAQLDEQLDLPLLRKAKPGGRSGHQRDYVLTRLDADRIFAAERGNSVDGRDLCGKGMEVCAYRAIAVQVADLIRVCRKARGQQQRWQQSNHIHSEILAWLVNRGSK